MIRYRLDDLGAFQFEWLVQSLLKSAIGPGLESWGGRADHGVDIYSAGPLFFPNKDVSVPGPFVFQIKFVQNANAAGAHPTGAIRDAVQHEKSRILDRAHKGQWKPLQHYILVTNALLTVEFRTWAEGSLREVLPETGLHFLCGADVCDLLDAQPTIRQSFPQILGLRDLNELIQGAINKKDIEKSRSAIDCASVVAPIFVPTRAYHQAWKTLFEHRFAVLEGPAEMGKSAIAWMIALAQVSNEWQAVYCAEPDVFFSQHDVNQHQIFIADDAFGLTEYDPARSQKWERELALVMRRLDSRHWLIWTSRKHILERGLKTLDFTRDFPEFPHPSAVVVNAESLTEKEKALILYRHAKRASLNEIVRAHVRQQAKRIVSDSNLTPERVRILTREVLPKFNDYSFDVEETVSQLVNEINEVIKNPTDRSRKTFAALPASHKWLLISMLEMAWPDVQGVRESYDRLCPSENKEPFEDIIDQLTDSFIKQIRPDDVTSHLRGNKELLSWTHPSYRDLVIDELVRHPALSNRFLSRTNLAGITLAISSGGGRYGDRQLPFLTSQDAWKLFSQRSVELAATENPFGLPDLLETLSSAFTEITETDLQRHLSRILRDVSEVVRSRWDGESRALKADEVNAYRKATALLNPIPSSPNLSTGWNVAVSLFRREIEESKSQAYLWLDDTKAFLELAMSIASLEPRFLSYVAFPDKYRDDFEEVLAITTTTVEADLDEGDEEGMRNDYYRLSTARDTVSLISKVLPELAERTGDLMLRLKYKADVAEEVADSADDREPDYDVQAALSTEEGDYDIDAIFFDL